MKTGSICRMTTPEPGEAPFMEEVSLLAGEEFNALVFNALHGYYRQAIGCLRNALETLIAGAGLAVTGNQELFKRWRNAMAVGVALRSQYAASSGRER
jgi:hypothetical protein